MVFQDSVDTDLFNELQKQVSNFQYMPWFLSKHTAYPESSENIFDTSFSHIAIKESKNLSDLAELSRICIAYALANANVKFTELIRVRFGLLLAWPNQRIHEAHIDSVDTHKVGLLYLNDSDGDTFLYDNFYDPELDNGLSKFDYYQKHVKDNLKLQQQVTPESNKLVLFNGWQYHASSCPTKNAYRLVMNFNYR